MNMENNVSPSPQSPTGFLDQRGGNKPPFIGVFMREEYTDCRGTAGLSPYPIPQTIENRYKLSPSDSRPVSKAPVSFSSLIRGFLGLCLLVVLLLGSSEAQAGQLADRLAQFPRWESKPPVTVAEGDLIYPDWMEGTWNVTSTLVDQVAPLAPEVVTPGFESNRRYLNQPVSFRVRFQANSAASMRSQKATQTVISDQFMPLKTQNPKLQTFGVVADRAFNGLNIAKAYLGDRIIQSVKVDPNSPNRQITSLQTGRQLISVVTGRGTETPSPKRFIATEVTNQVFRGTPQPYFNQVETTTAYHLLPSVDHSSTSSSEALPLAPSLAIEADQVTAVYLSPQDADYFKALDRPVALYRYRLELLRVSSQKTTDH
jgi:hypothetical protein